MSNTTQSSHSSGSSKRRRSRGGKNRGRNDGRQHSERSHGQSHGSRQARSEEFRPQGPRPSRHAPPAPVLSWWQKLLSAVGLYKAPTPPARPAPGPAPAAAKSTPAEPRPPKSNTRNARGGDSGRGERGDSETRPPRGGRGGERSRGGDSSTVESARVYVGNLAYEVSEQDLQELFKGIGGVRGVEIVYNRSTHRSKGYAFVEMVHKDEAIRAVEVLNDQHFMGRKLLVSGAKSRGQDEREDSEGRDDAPQSRVVVAPLPVFPSGEETAAAPAVEDEPQIDSIVVAAADTPAETPAEDFPAEEVAPTADELVSKYGFEEPEEKQPGA